jgi:hypothetical protein
LVAAGGAGFAVAVDGAGFAGAGAGFAVVEDAEGFAAGADATGFAGGADSAGLVDAVAGVEGFAVAGVAGFAACGADLSLSSVCEVAVVAGFAGAVFEVPDASGVAGGTGCGD